MIYNKIISFEPEVIFEHFVGPKFINFYLLDYAKSAQNSRMQIAFPSLDVIICIVPESC